MTLEEPNTMRRHAEKVLSGLPANGDRRLPVWFLACLDALDVAEKRIAELETMVHKRADEVAGWASVNLRNELRISELEAELEDCDRRSGDMTWKDAIA